jgi:hypothetical protein
MANRRSNSRVKRRPDPLPEHFRSLDEAAEFWDTHDSADYEEHMRDVECEVDIRRRVHMVSLDTNLYLRVSAIAQARGVSAETLVNLWVQEKAG